MEAIFERRIKRICRQSERSSLKTWNRQRTRRVRLRASRPRRRNFVSLRGRQITGAFPRRRRRRKMFELISIYAAIITRYELQMLRNPPFLVRGERTCFAPARKICPALRKQGRALFGFRIFWIFRIKQGDFDVFLGVKNTFNTLNYEMDKILIMG